MQENWCKQGFPLDLAVLSLIVMQKLMIVFFHSMSYVGTILGNRAEQHNNPSLSKASDLTAMDFWWSGNIFVKGIEVYLQENGESQKMGATFKKASVFSILN